MASEPDTREMEKNEVNETDEGGGLGATITIREMVASIAEEIQTYYPSSGADRGTSLDAKLAVIDRSTRRIDEEFNRIGRVNGAYLNESLKDAENRIARLERELDISKAVGQLDAIDHESAVVLVGAIVDADFYTNPAAAARRLKETKPFLFHSHYRGGMSPNQTSRALNMIADEVDRAEAKRGIERISAWLGTRKNLRF
jgi:hypothetical protein